MDASLRVRRSTAEERAEVFLLGVVTLAANASFLAMHAFEVGRDIGGQYASKQWGAILIKGSGRR